MGEKQTYEIHHSKWPELLTKDLERHFERMGEDLVKFDVSNHRYGETEKHYAALYFLETKRNAREARQTLTLTIGKWTLLIATLTLVAALVAVKLGWK